MDTLSIKVNVSGRCFLLANFIYPDSVGKPFSIFDRDTGVVRGLIGPVRPWFVVDISDTVLLLRQILPKEYTWVAMCYV